MVTLAFWILFLGAIFGSTACSAIAFFLVVAYNALCIYQGIKSGVRGVDFWKTLIINGGMLVLCIFFFR